MILRVYRCNPSTGEKPRYDTFEVELQEKMSVLDALVEIQSRTDPSIAFRYACRSGMCGTCSMTIDGVPRWTCRTSLARLGRETITIEPLRHLPVIKDLAVDMAPFFDDFRRIIPNMVPLEVSETPARIPPSEPGRQKIAPNLECIGCGCCYASCGIPAMDPAYLGPAALNRAFTLIHDIRDARRKERLDIIDNEHGAWRCHTQATCTNVCPKDIDTSGAIHDLKRMAAARRSLAASSSAADSEAAASESPSAALNSSTLGRREFLRGSALSALGVVAAGVGIPLAAGALAPPVRAARSAGWVDMGPLEAFPLNQMTSKRYQVPEAAREWGAPAESSVFILRTGAGVQALSPICTHKRCTVDWSPASGHFVCPCHGGVFDRSGGNISGPPPRPLESFEARVENGRVLVNPRV